MILRDRRAGGKAGRRALARVTPLLPAGDLVLVAHGHPLRALTVRWLRLHPDGGRPFRPATGTLSTRGMERSQPVILSP